MLASKLGPGMERLLGHSPLSITPLIPFKLKTYDLKRQDNYFSHSQPAMMRWLVMARHNRYNTILFKRGENGMCREALGPWQFWNPAWRKLLFFPPPLLLLLFLSSLIFFIFFVSSFIDSCFKLYYCLPCICLRSIFALLLKVLKVEP